MLPGSKAPLNITVLLPVQSHLSWQFAHNTQACRSRDNLHMVLRPAAVKPCLVSLTVFFLLLVSSCHNKAFVSDVGSNDRANQQCLSWNGHDLLRHGVSVFITILSQPEDEISYSVTRPKCLVTSFHSSPCTFFAKWLSKNKRTFSAISKTDFNDCAVDWGQGSSVQWWSVFARLLHTMPFHT